MVRQKSRWLLIRIEYESDVKNISKDQRENQQQQEDDTAPLPTDLVRTQLYHSIRCTMEDAFGIAASGITEDMQVLFYNTDTGLAMIKVPRDSSNLVRSAITIMTQLNNVPMVATVLSTNGSARTAKLATIRELKRMFQNRYALPTQERLKKLQEHMDQVVCNVE